MKKLMTMIAAVAMSFGLFADGVTLNAAFDASKLNKGPYAPTAPGWAAYSGAEGTLNIVNDDEPRVLEIKTGTAELARNVATDGNAWEITNLYLEASIDFQKQALEDVPTNISAEDKIALFILDTSDIEGAPGTTNLFAMAGFGANGKALFDLGEVDDAWFASDKKIAIKAYDNVFQTGKRTGFLVSVGTTVAPLTVIAVYPIDDGVVDWNYKMTKANYLGLANTGITLVSKVSKWAKQGDDYRKLLFSMADGTALNGKLTSVGFTGNAQIASVGFTETDPGFGSDSVGMNLSVTEGVAFTLTPESIAAGFEANGTSITGPASGDPFTFTVDKGDFDNVTVTLTTKIDPDDQGVYAAELTPSSTLTVEGWDTVAWVGNTPFKSLFGDDPDTCAIANVNANGGTLKLAQAVEVGELEAEVLNFTGSDVVLDLNGQTITITGENKTLSNVGKLTITDSSVAQTGTIVGMIINSNNLIVDKGIIDGMFVNSYGEVAGVTTISNGTFNGMVVNVTDGASEASIDPDEIKIIAVGGKFLQEDDQQQPVNTKEAVEEFLPAPGEKTYEVVDDENGYWQVVEVTAYTITVDSTIEHGAVTTDPADKAEVGETVTVIADPADDYKLGAITVEQEDGTPVDVGEDGTFEMPAANVTVSATFVAKDYVAQIVGGQSFETLAEAFAAVENDETIKLLAAVTEGVLYEDAKKFTIDLNGQTWTWNGGQEGNWAALKVFGGAADITIVDNAEGGKMYAAGDGFCIWAKSGKVTINSGKFYNNSNDDYAIYVNGTAQVVINDGEFRNEKDAPYIWKGDLAKLNLNVENNNLNATITVYGGTYSAEPKDDSGVKFVAEGKKAVENEGIWTVKDIEYATLTIAEVANLTINVTNAEGQVQNTGDTFDKDLATKLYVTRTPASGYELDGYAATEIITMSADVTVTGAVKSASQPVNPGEEKKYEKPEEAQAAAKAINDNKEAMIKVPAEAEATKTAYLERVAAKVLADGLTVVVDIAADKEATFKTELDTEIKKDTVAAALTDATATKATIATVAGFYYWIEGGVEVGTINQNGEAKIGTGLTVTLDKPALGTTTKAFYKLAVGVKDPAITGADD